MDNKINSHTFTNVISKSCFDKLDNNGRIYPELAYQKLLKEFVRQERKEKLEKIKKSDN